MSNLREIDDLGDEDLTLMAIAKVLNEIFNDGAEGSDVRTGFALMVFPFGDPGGRCKFVCNGALRPQNVVAMLKRHIAKLEGHADVEGHA